MADDDLTDDLIARAFPEPASDEPCSMPLRSQDEIDASRAEFLGQLHPDEDIWLFGYGSLMWKPEVEYAERQRALVRGWRRRFCLWTWRWRGSRAAPGMMMGLDRGGACAGVLFRIAAPAAGGKLAGVWRREMIGRAYRPVWVTAETPKRWRRALCFVADRASERYAGELPLADAAHFIAGACGSMGANAVYLLETWRHCEAIGIQDPMLRALQRLVASEIAARRP